MSKEPTSRQAALWIIGRLHEAGFQAFLAGGCVRDKLLGEPPKDYDVATNALPEKITRLFPNCLTIGAQFGVVMVLHRGRQVEVATFRSDYSYQDGRHPEAVTFTDARHDALRRDFTINGMFFDPVTEEVIDYVDGRGDLKSKTIRAIGDPNERFAEDHLRMLRAIRFAARLEFEIDPPTWRAIEQQAPQIQRISPERILAELEIILTDPHRARAVQLAYDCKLLHPIFQSLSDEQLSFGVAMVRELPRQCSFSLALAALLTDVPADQINHLCRDLKASNDLRKQVHFLVAGRTKLLKALPLSKGHLKLWLAEPCFQDLLILIRSYLRCTARSITPLRQLQKQIKDLGDEPIQPPVLLDGHQLIELGAVPGPGLGQLTRELYLAQLEGQLQTTAQARDWTKEWLHDHKQK